MKWSEPESFGPCAVLDTRHIWNHVITPVPFGGRALSDRSYAFPEGERGPSAGSRCPIFATGPAMPDRSSSASFRVHPDAGEVLTRWRTHKKCSV
jgi:hypothetical protein